MSRMLGSSSMTRIVGSASNAMPFLVGQRKRQAKHGGSVAASTVDGAAPAVRDALDDREAEAEPFTARPAAIELLEDRIALGVRDTAAAIDDGRPRAPVAD